jgi:ethanolamine ammonia-lyase small subunit
MSDISNRDAVPAAPATPMRDLRTLTSARVALERTGISVTTHHALEFSLAHAQARDAVYSALAVPSLMAALRERGLTPLAVRSAASNRTEYLRRPDLGRTLANSSAELLAARREEDRKSGTVVSVILADGLSALAVERHALPLLDALLPLLRLGTDAAATKAADWALAPVIVAEQARVALGDVIGAALEANVTVMLIGERPGLSSPASLGTYITWAPWPRRTDAQRNCVSNIHTEGLGYAAAAAKIAWFVTEARRLGLTGVDLRESNMPRLSESGSGV